MSEILHSTPDTRNVVLATLDTPSVGATGCPDATFDRDCCPVIEALAVAIIVLATAHGTVRYLLHLNQKIADAYTLYKIQLGRALLLGLEFLVAADIIRTVGLETTMQNVIILGLLVVVRTFLSWSLVVEIYGRGPWQARESERVE